MDPRATGSGDDKSLEWRGRLNYSYAERNERASFKPHPNQVHVETDFDKLPQPSTPLYAPQSGGSAEIYNAYGSKQVKFGGGTMTLSTRSSPYPTAGRLSGMAPSLLDIEKIQASSASSQPVSSPSTAPNPLAGPTTQRNPLASQPPTKISSHEWIRKLKSSNMTVFPTSVLSQIGGESSSSSLQTEMSLSSTPAFPAKAEESGPSKEEKAAEKALGSFFAAAGTTEKPASDPPIDWSARCQKTPEQHDEGGVASEFPLLGRALAAAAPSKPQKARRSSSIVKSVLMGVAPSVVEGSSGAEKRPRPEDGLFASLSSGTTATDTYRTGPKGLVPKAASFRG